jgi:hypothetical protein
MEFLILNPTMPQRQVAQHFGVTQAWLSTIIHSSAFQLQLKERQDQLFGTNVVPLHEKMMSLAHLAVDRLSDRVEVTDSGEEVQKIAELALKNLGYGSGIAAQEKTGITIEISGEDLARARSKIGLQLVIAPEDSCAAG